MPKVLVADDGEFLRVRVARMLSVEGFTVVEAENGSKAVELYHSENPDIILLDISLPDKNGLSVLKEIRAANPEAKVVMLTALGQESSILEAIRAGAKDFVVKPFEKDRLIAAVRKQLGVVP